MVKGTSSAGSQQETRTLSLSAQHVPMVLLTPRQQAVVTHHTGIFPTITAMFSTITYSK
jgi:hypothetical protein